MIPSDILYELVPDRDPEDEFDGASRFFELSKENPGRRIGMWAEYLRHCIRRTMLEDKELERLVDTSGFIGTGVFRVPGSRDSRSFQFEGFPIVSGYQFGAVLMRASRAKEADGDGDYIRAISLEGGRVSAPLTQTIATFNPHVPQVPDGFVSAHFMDVNGQACSITAAHVVQNYRIGQRVPVYTHFSRHEPRLLARAPGFIDAAKIEFPFFRYRGLPEWPAHTVRQALESETVELHLGHTGTTKATIVQSLSTSSQIKSAAVPRHFLTSLHGHPGDSGSLICSAEKDQDRRNLIGMYLGDTNCQDVNGAFVTYGYALDLQQAADMFGATDLWGEFND